MKSSALRFEIPNGSPVALNYSEDSDHLRFPRNDDSDLLEAPRYRASNMFESVSHASGNLSGKRPPKMKCKAAFWKNKQKEANPGHSILESTLSEVIHDIGLISNNH
jgi:hypothetical protein